jgi:eukaryotic-like serine/threonine-protein kinase
MTDRPADSFPLADDETRSQAPTIQPASIGSYRLLQRIGEGGMGDVWLAEQTAPVRRQVAVKIIKAGMDTGRVVVRFEAERQALAVMDHPAIAKVFDAGATPEGRPYFIMEYVRGASITAYCNRNRLSTRARLDLFLQVCEGVQHAHQKGIIHRDLKPSNILVTQLDDRPVPKIIDFGVAKAITQPLTDHTLFTELGALLGTPEYMSPEQAEMSGIDIDTRTDVYALGVILYELLTGILPFEGKALRQKGIDEIRRTIREVEPLRPSVRVTQAVSSDAAVSQRPDVATVAGQLRGDLDWITMRALEKDRTRRYGSAAELAADLHRHVSHVPVLASPPSSFYRVRKFARRHRVGVSVAAMLAGLLIAFAATTGVQARRIARERDRANREAQIARAVSDFLQNDLLAQASANTQARPDTSPDPALTVRTALDRAAARAEGKFDNEPLVEASIRQTIGITYRDLGLYAEAQRQLERARDLRRRNLGEQHADTLTAATNLALIYRRQGKLAQAEPLLSSVLETLRRVRGERDANTLETMDTLSGLYREQGKFAQAEPLLEKTLELKRQVLGGEHPETLATQNNLGLLYWNEGKYAQAEPMYTSALEIRRRVSGPEHPETLTLMNNLATLYYRKGEYEQAQPLLAGVLDARRRVLGEEHPSTLVSMNNLAMAYKVGGKLADAESLFSKALASRRRVLGEEHPDTLVSMNNLGTLYATEGRHAQGETLLRPLLEIRRRVAGKTHPDTLNTMVWLGRIRLHRAEYAGAESLLRDALTGYEASRESWERYTCRSLLGASLAGQKKYAQAEPLLISGYEGMAQRIAAIPGDRRADVEEGGKRIVRLYEVWGKPSKAAEWKARLTK